MGQDSSHLECSDLRSLSCIHQCFLLMGHPPSRERVHIPPNGMFGKSPTQKCRHFSNWKICDRSLAGTIPTQHWGGKACFEGALRLVVGTVDGSEILHQPPVGLC